MSIFTYKELDIPEINKEIPGLINEYSDIIDTCIAERSFFNLIDIPKNKKIFDTKIAAVALIMSQPKSYATPHTDGRLRESASKLALNIPVSGCENTKTIFYKSSDTSPSRIDLVKSSNSHINRVMQEKAAIAVAKNQITDYPCYYIHKRQYLKKLCELELKVPTLINVNETPHQVNNFNNTVRVALSLRFYKDPLHWATYKRR